MPLASVNGIKLYYEVTGKGFPIVWLHEFAGGYKSWDSQIKYFSRRYQVITYNARGYPPSDVPTELEAYSQEHAVEDLYQLLCHLGIKQAYIVGCSMGGSAGLNFSITHPDMVKALVIIGTGSGTTDREEFLSIFTDLAQQLETDGMKTTAENYSRAPNRLQLLRKDPKGWQEYFDEFISHSAIGSAFIIRGFMFRRPTIFTLETQLQQLTMPVLIMVGDEDNYCIEPAIFMKRKIPNSGLVILPQTGHVPNLEDPEIFNRIVSDFLTSVEALSWANT